MNDPFNMAVTLSGDIYNQIKLIIYQDI